ncbi:tetraspanin-1-like isoform X2 [Rhinatrema bivittatum]|uniref:tetraspanin-1-like isoform X2 n=1 Tax=Rhinatrema bivittatum TaxID=194408 RepID=UPI00112AE0BE|nr:tetraspanin-1-like isoform X2 [Rhinatrema bivittatum]XP_029442441.1 tetraspanin-1-like isoform X2 [Rhinatrema bivittatum]
MAFSVASSRVPSSGLHSFYVCLKYMMFFFNSIIFISGGVLVGLGIWIRYGSGLFAKILGSHATHFFNIGYFCIVVGLMLTVLGFLGCLGAIKESRFLLMTFIMTMMAMFIAKIAAAVLALAFSQIVEGILHDKGLISLKEDYDAEYIKDGSVTLGWDFLMRKLKCCGFNNYTDFSASQFVNRSGLVYPKACCWTPASPACNGKNVSSAVIFSELVSILIAMVLFVKLG